MLEMLPIFLFIACIAFIVGYLMGYSTGKYMTPKQKMTKCEMQDALLQMEIERLTKREAENNVYKQIDEINQQAVKEFERKG